jgi:hypothetical protein
MACLSRGSSVAQLLHMQSALKNLGAAGLCFMIMAVTSLVAAPSGKGKREGDQAKVAAPAQPRVAVHVSNAPRAEYFTVEQVRVVREYYGPKYRKLPPGLQKKYARTGQLPPGWEKRMEPLPVVIERELPRLPEGHRRGVIDGHAIVYNSRAGTIIDVAVLF